jgi:hypothetical protein
MTSPMKSQGHGQNDQIAMYQEALCLVLEHRLASVGLIQRRLKLGYTQAHQLMEAMARNGAVSNSIEQDGYRRILWSDTQRISYLLAAKVKQLGPQRDPARIPLVLNALRLVWEEMPDLRLGQLIVNTVKPTEACPELFYVEDAHLLELSLAALEAQG